MIIEELFKPGKDVIALSKLRASNDDTLHDESRYEEHGDKILDSFVSRTNNIINQFREGYVGV